MTIFQTAAPASRRDFLKSTSAATVATASSGLVLGVALPGTAGQVQAAGTMHTPNAWVHIADDNTITLMAARSEMGQGVYTSMSQLIAEELNVSLSQVRVEAAPAAAVYANALLGAQITGGSTSVRDGWEKLRVAGAQVREMLVTAAAQAWGVSTDQVKADNGHLTGPGGKKATYGQMAEAASKLPVPEKPALKDPKDFKVVGTRAKRVDTDTKVYGTAEFGVDVKLPGMVYASLTQSPVIGGKVKSFDASRAKGMPGVIDVVQIPDGIAVVADSWWRAKTARDTISIDWDDGPIGKMSDASMIAETRAALSTEKAHAITPAKGDVNAAYAGAAKQLQAEFVQPLQSHSPLEPMNFTAHVQGGKALLIGPTQFQQGAQGSVAAALGLKPEDVTIKTTYLGGGFGRRIELDFIVQAAQISKAVNKPVKLLWTREDDMPHDFYRPVAVHQLKAGLDASGNIVSWQFKASSQSVTQRAFGLPKDVLDPFIVEYAVAPYGIPNYQAEMVMHDTGFRMGYWRAVSHNMNAFANESFIDELAKAAGKDPVAFRMSMLADKPRHAAVLKLAAEKAGWGKPLPKGHARGVALMDGYDTYMAQIAEISLDDNGEVKVHKVTVAVDLGQIVNPDTVEAQLQSSIVFGMGPALKHKITMAQGRVQQTNFNTYPPVRMLESPAVDIHIIKSTEKPGGIGEPATAVIGAALGNAIAALTGKRVRSYPMTAQAIREA
jgi:isoquinoline 1-oxidoreductase subunit beta